MIEIYVKLIKAGMRSFESVAEKVPHLIDAIKARLIEEGYKFD